MKNWENTWENHKLKIFMENFAYTLVDIRKLTDINGKRIGDIF